MMPPTSNVPSARVVVTSGGSADSPGAGAGRVSPILMRGRSLGGARVDRSNTTRPVIVIAGFKVIVTPVISVAPTSTSVIAHRVTGRTVPPEMPLGSAGRGTSTRAMIV